MRTAGARTTALLLLTLAFASRAGAATDVSIRTDDGVTLAAVWNPPAQAAPAVLLLHSYLRTHADWDAVASRLHDAGLGVLELDLRGHGRSGGSGTDQFLVFPRDVKAALVWLKEQPDVMSGHIGIGGLSLGATLAVIGAAGEPSVRSLVLVSPAMEFRGLRCDAAMHTFAARSGAALIAAGALDPYGSRSARQLADIEPGLRDLHLLDDTSANGRALLQEQPDLVSAVVDWFRRTLL
jgi:alpha-beta hydrolase superfamily lysophospholipase